MGNEKKKGWDKPGDRHQVLHLVGCPHTLTVSMCQINPTVGDLDGNTAKIIRAISAVKESDLIVFPELSVQGYPPEDLLFRRHFIEESRLCLDKIAKACPAAAAVIVGCAVEEKGRLYNCAIAIQGKKIIAVYKKRMLPNYGVFDEKRYFDAGDKNSFVTVKGRKVFLTVCEDIWVESNVSQLASDAEKAGGADVIVNISASPFSINKHINRESVFKRVVDAAGAFFVWVNLVGGQDELVFDGKSMVLSPQTDMAAQAGSFDENILTARLDFETMRGTVVSSRGQGDEIKSAQGCGEFQISDFKSRFQIDEADNKRIKDVYNALVLGVRDYMRKNGFKEALLGLSGGIDSALSLVIAADAAGPANVKAVSLPSRYTARQSIDDSALLCAHLGVRMIVEPIDDIYVQYLKRIEPHTGSDPYSLEKQNLQSRIRGAVLMALSNKWNALVLTTGNKSEISTGYCTLYGDTAGGFCVLKDVFKTMVYELARYYNGRRGRDVIPQAVIDRAPTAELKPGQRDDDDLPPYPVLDKILACYIEEGMSVEEIIGAGHDAGIVRRVARLVNRNEYKRRQAPPGAKITELAFGRERRYPLTNKYQE